MQGSQNGGGPMDESQTLESMTLQNSSNEGSTVHCPSCGYDIEVDATFCEECGSKLTSDAAKGGESGQVETTQGALQVHSNDQNALALRAKIFNINGRYEEALCCAEELTSSDIEEWFVWCQKAIALSGLERHNEAFACCENAIKADPRSFDVWLTKSKVLEGAERLEEALECMEKALKLSALPNELCIGYTLRGNILKRLKREVEALASYQHSLELKPDDDESNKRLLCQSCGADNDVNGSFCEHCGAKLANVSVSDHSEDPRAPKDKYDALIDEAARKYVQGQNEASLLLVEEAQRINPSGDADTWWTKAHALRGLGRKSEALASIEHLLELSPARHNAWCFKGEILAQLKRSREALAAFDRSLDLEQNNPNAWYGKGIVLLFSHNPELALAPLGRALELDPRNTKAWICKAQAFSQLGRDQEALSSAEEALRLDEQQADAWTQKGYALGGLRKGEEAIQCHERATEIDPNSADAWLAKAITLQTLLHRNKEALGCLERVAKLQPMPEPARMCLILCMRADILCESGSLHDAMAFYERALQIKPDDVDCKDGIELCRLGERFTTGPLKDAIEAVIKTAGADKLALWRIEPRIIEAFARESLSEQFDAAEKMAVAGLGGCRPVVAVLTSIVDAVQGDELMAKLARMKAIIALGHIRGYPLVLKALSKVYETYPSDSAEFYWALVSLGAIGDPIGRPLLERAAAHGARGAAAALRLFGNATVEEIAKVA